MISLQAIRAVPRNGPDWEEAEGIKADLRALRLSRQPFFLDPADLAPVLRYKLREQEQRCIKHRRGWTTSLVTAVTQAAFSIQLEDQESEAAVRVGILASLPGVGVPVASAILALAEPEKFAIIDFRAWRQVFETEKRSFSSADYVRYMRAIRKLSEQLNWAPQVVDWCMWRRDQLA